MIVVFAGPTLGHAEAGRLLAATFRPPAAQGDVYRAVLDGAQTIGLIDGYFHSVPSVWHKEILWALSRGVRVYGAASMGALRAAELVRFGMRGVGWVFEQFAAGALEDDDEVAVAHAPEAYGFCASSLAMVNIRRTLALAEERQVITQAAAARLCERLKHTFYAERTLPLLDRYAREELTPTASSRFLAHLTAGGVVDQKREDACALLAELARPAAPAEPPSFVFEHTAVFELVRRGEPPATEPGPLSARDAAVLTELKLLGRFREVEQDALFRAACLALASQLELGPSRDGASAAARRLQRAARLDDGAFAAWLEDNAIAGSGMLEREDLVSAVLAALGVPAPEHSLDALRRSGGYARLAARAHAKAAWLARHELPPVPPEDALVSWFCATRGPEVPRGTLAEIAARLRMEPTALRAALHLDWAFATANAVGADA